ncbi:endonuclease/exonuclease/phosphatase family protein [Isoptericola halotolerans]
MVLALALAVLLVLHDLLPAVGGLRSLVATALPWCGLVLAGLGLLAVLRRTALGGLAVLFATGVWLWVCLPFLAPAASGGGDLVVVLHNVADTNTDPAWTARVLLGPEPDVVTLVEVTPELADEFERSFAQALPHSALQGTVGVWSRHPITDADPVDLRPPGVDTSWDRGLRVVLDTPGAPGLAVYAVHLPSVRLGAQGLTSGPRDDSLRMLGDVLAADGARAVVVGGDFNTVLADGAFDPVLAQVETPPGSLGFTFPARLPAVRIDHVLARGAEVTGISTLGRTASDHLPVVADVVLPPG